MIESKGLNKELLNLLVRYFKAEVPLLEQSYSWKIPQIDGFEDSLKESYSANVKLKHFLNSTWRASKNDDLSVAKLIIEKWGGVNANKEDTLKKYINRVNSGEFEMPFEGLASYTKLYSIAEPKRFAIYDARVAVTLNAIQLNAKVKSGIAFNYLPGRNNVTGNTITNKGFSRQKEFSVANLVKKGWERLLKNRTYETYLDYLMACIEHHPGWKLYELEMVLFANAEKEALKAMRSIQDSQKTKLNSQQMDTKNVSSNKLTNHQSLLDYVVNEALLPEKFSYTDVLLVAQRLLKSASKSGQHYAVLKFIQNYCSALDKSVSLELRTTTDPRRMSCIGVVKTSCEFQLI